MIPAREALRRLREGNLRFVNGDRSPDAAPPPTRPGVENTIQRPHTIVLGCSDSRVPTEIVFDQGPGDLFVVRVAGNIAAPSQIGSIEFAAVLFATRLVVVLGHTGCGAVTATLEELRRPTPDLSKGVRSIIERVRPAVESLLAEETEADPETLLHRAVRANVRAVADRLRHDSDCLNRLIAEDELLVVGAEYSLETGAVDFFDGAPAIGGPGGDRLAG